MNSDTPQKEDGDPTPTIASETPPELLTDKLLDHIEKTFGDNYRKEIDQEENIWRSLPFFAASLALQLAALVGLANNVPNLGVATWWSMIALLTLIAICSLATIAFLFACIAQAKFRYLASEPDLRDYALNLAAAEAGQREAASLTPSSDGLTILKNEIARQYGLATHNNRLINQRRATLRTYAGLCMLASILATLILVGVTIHAHMRAAYRAPEGVQTHGDQSQPRLQDRALDDRDAIHERRSDGNAQPQPLPGASSPTGNARGDEGLERNDGGAGASGGSREGGS